MQCNEAFKLEAWLMVFYMLRKTKILEGCLFVLGGGKERSGTQLFLHTVTPTTNSSLLARTAVKDHKPIYASSTQYFSVPPIWELLSTGTHIFSPLILQFWLPTSPDLLPFPLIFLIQDVPQRAHIPLEGSSWCSSSCLLSSQQSHLNNLH